MAYSKLLVWLLHRRADTTAELATNFWYGFVHRKAEAVAELTAGDA